MPIAKEELAVLKIGLKSIVVKDPKPNTTLIAFVVGALEVPQTQQIGYAVLKHAVDVLAEFPQLDQIDTFVEAYSRTLLDANAAARYGTAEMVPPDYATATAMIQYLGMRQDVDERGLSYIGPEGSTARH